MKGFDAKRLNSHEKRLFKICDKLFGDSKSTEEESTKSTTTTGSLIHLGELIKEELMNSRHKYFLYLLFVLACEN